MTESYYEFDGSRYRATAWTRGPWDPLAQHAGPPAALLARAAELVDPDPEWQTSRFTMEILRPIPVAALDVHARMHRPGKRVRNLQAVLTVDGVEHATASLWQIKVAAGQELGAPPLPHRLPEEIAATPIIHDWDPSYLSSIEWRFLHGGFDQLGPCAVWTRQKPSLVGDEVPSALARVLVIADSGNGVSSVLPLDRALYINVELSVHLIRAAVGEWICLDAVTRIGGRGIGLAESNLWDTQGWLGRGAQSLLVAERTPTK